MDRHCKSVRRLPPSLRLELWMFPSIFPSSRPNLGAKRLPRAFGYDAERVPYDLHRNVENVGGYAVGVVFLLREQLERVVPHTKTRGRGATLKNGLDSV